MKWKVILGLALVAVLGLGAVGAGAWFTDVDASDGNTFTAGILDLMVDGSVDDPGQVWVFEDMAPGEVQQKAVTVKNRDVSTMDGKLSVKITGITNSQNGFTEPEDDADPSRSVKDISNHILIRWHFPDTGWTSWMNLQNQKSVERYLGDLSVGEVQNVSLRAKLAEDAGSEYQTDRATVDIDFILDQDH